MNILLFDMGLPMIFPSLFLMVSGLVPVILLEAHIVARTLNLQRKQALSPIALANVVTTLFGIPASWLILVVLEFGIIEVAGGSADSIWTDIFSITLGAAWVAPRAGNESWIIFGAMLFLLIPYFAASWGIEFLVARRKLRERTSEDKKALIFRTVGKANLASYLLLVGFWILLFGLTAPF